MRLRKTLLVELGQRAFAALLMESPHTMPLRQVLVNKNLGELLDLAEPAIRLRSITTRMDHQLIDKMRAHRRALEDADKRLPEARARRVVINTRKRRGRPPPWWSPEEIEILRCNASKGAVAVAALLNRSPGSVRGMAYAQARVSLRQSGQEGGLRMDQRIRRRDVEGAR